LFIIYLFLIYQKNAKKLGLFYYPRERGFVLTYYHYEILSRLFHRHFKILGL